MEGKFNCNKIVIELCFVNGWCDATAGAWYLLLSRSANICGRKLQLTSNTALAPVPAGALSVLADAF
jgi:hypothetical protein